LFENDLLIGCQKKQLKIDTVDTVICFEAVIQDSASDVIAYFFYVVKDAVYALIF
jgi:hypothetical protein